VADKSIGRDMMTTAETKLLFPGLAGFYASWRDIAYTAMRVIIGYILLMHGWLKVRSPLTHRKASGAKRKCETHATIKRKALPRNWRDLVEPWEGLGSCTIRSVLTVLFGSHCLVARTSTRPR